MGKLQTKQGFMVISWWVFKCKTEAASPCKTLDSFPCWFAFKKLKTYGGEVGDAIQKPWTDVYLMFCWLQTQGLNHSRSSENISVSCWFYWPILRSSCFFFKNGSQTHCRCQRKVLSRFPSISNPPGTVTYLTECGAPTLILQCRNSLRPSETAQVYGSLAGVDGVEGTSTHQVVDIHHMDECANWEIEWLFNGKIMIHNNNNHWFPFGVLYFQTDPWEGISTWLLYAILLCIFFGCIFSIF